MDDQAPIPISKATIRTRRTYSDAEKVQAVLASAVLGPGKVQKAMDIPKRTLSEWRADPKLQKHVDKTLDEIADGFRVLVGMAQEALVTRIPSMDGRDLTILMGVATDKHQLVTGKATARTESRVLTGMNDADVRDALREADRIVAAGRAQGTASDEAAGG